MTVLGQRLGIAARPEGGGIDFDRLRADRRARLFREMAAAGLDAVVLGRPANIAFATGARQLWTSGTRPFGPGAVAVAETAQVHLLSVWDEGVPTEIGHERLFGLSWNPANLLRSVKAMDGLAGATRVGTDALSPGFPQFLGAVAPNAQLVDATPALRAARDVKSEDEQACLATAAALAEAALATMVAALRPGVSERELLACYSECLSRLGAPTPPSEAVARVSVPRQVPWPPGVATAAPAARGDLVILSPGALYAGYEAGLARTIRVPGAVTSPPTAALAARTRDQLIATVEACRPGATGAEVRAAWRAAGGVDGPLPILHGLGLGAEAPVVSAAVGGDEVLRPGMVVMVQAWAAEEGLGGCLEADTVVIDAGGPRRLTRFVQPER